MIAWQQLENPNIFTEMTEEKLIALFRDSAEHILSGKEDQDEKKFSFISLCSIAMDKRNGLCKDIRDRLLIEIYEVLQNKIDEVGHELWEDKQDELWTGYKGLMK